MKNFKTFLLTEGVSPILYHNTSVNRLAKILELDEFVLASDMGTSADKNLNGHKFKPFYLSTSRIKYGGYARSLGEDYLSCIVLDGKKLSERLSGSPVDYWGKEFRGDITDNPNQEDRYLRNNENEDRLFSTEGILKDAHKYIKEVHVMYCKPYAILQDNNQEFKTLSETEKEEAYKAIDWYKAITIHCDMYSIPLFFYTDFADFKVQNKRKARTNKSRESELTFVLRFLKANSKDELDERTQKRLSNYVWDSRDVTISLENHIHNKKGDRTETQKLQQVVKIMNKLKIHTIKDLVLYIRNKFKEE